MGSQSNERGNNDALYVVTEVAKTLIAPLELPELLNAVMAKLAEVLEPAEFGVLLLWDPSEEVLSPQAVCGPGFQDLLYLRQIRLHEGESITGKVYAQGQAWLLNDPAVIAQAMANMRPANRAILARALNSDKAPYSVVAAPLSAAENRFGVLMLGTLHGSTLFTEADVQFIQAVAELIALAVDRARLETEAVAMREVEQADRLRAEALATLSHELRTPLAAIKGYSTALLLNEISWSLGKQQEFLQLIDEECENLQTMVHHVLDSALIDVGQLILEYQPVRLERLGRQVAEDMQRRSEKHQLIIDFPAGFPIVDADPVRIRQVLRNILDNAIKYSPHGGLVIIRGEVRPKDVVVSVSDQGVGISPEDQIPLFEKYFRVKSPTGYHVAGSGLGLPVARAVVEAHGGRIWAESAVDEGTTLYFSIPSQGLSSTLEGEE